MSAFVCEMATIRVHVGELVLVAVLHLLFATMSQSLTHSLAHSLTRSLGRDVPVTRDAAEAWSECSELLLGGDMRGRRYSEVMQWSGGVVP